MITETQTALVVKRYEDPEDKSLPWSKKFTFRSTNGMLFTSVEYTFEKVATVKVNDLVRVVWWEAPSSQRDRGRGPYETVHMSVASMGTEGIVLNASDDKQLVVHRSREKWTVVHASYQTPIRGTVWLCKRTHISIHNGMMHFNTSQIANGFCGYDEDQQTQRADDLAPSIPEATQAQHGSVGSERCHHRLVGSVGRARIGLRNEHDPANASTDFLDVQGRH